MTNIVISTIPAASVILNQFQKVDYQDCYSMVITKEHLELNDVMRSFFTSAPNWVITLMSLRDKVVGLLGLKINVEHVSVIPQNSSFQKGEKFGLFEILGRNTNEVIMGADDKHLDFRVSVFLKQNSDTQKQVYISTIALFHNRFGKTYMKIITPFHRLVVKAMMKKMHRNLVSR